MKIHIITDMEGCAGILDAQNYISPSSRYYEQGCELATLEASAAVEGALDAGATEILVVDGHGYGAMKRSLLHPKAKLLAGVSEYPCGADASFIAGIIVGQHAKSNTDGGHLCHTGSFGVEDQILNGVSMGELGMWMLVAGSFGMPIIMVSGDQAACDEAKELVPKVETAAVKFGVKRGSAQGLAEKENSVFNSAAIHLHPDEAHRLIREQACRAVKRIREIEPFYLNPPYTLNFVLRPEKGGGRGAHFTVASDDLLALWPKLEKAFAQWRARTKSARGTTDK